jgi:hypothetical protein
VCKCGEEIEITPEMIEAGAEAIAWLDFLDDPEKVVTSVFSAMWEKRTRVAGRSE